MARNIKGQWAKGSQSYPESVQLARESRARQHPEYHLWSESDDCVMKEFYPLQGALVVAKQLGVSVQAVYGRAKVLNIKRDKIASYSNRKYDASALIAYGKQHPVWNKGKKYTVEEQRKRSYDGQHAWSLEDDAIVQDMYTDYPAGLVAKIIGTTDQAVRGRAKKLKVRANLSERAKEIYARPNYHEAHLKRNRTPEARAQRSKCMKEIMADPVARAKFLAAGQPYNFHNNAENHTKALQASAKAWTSHRRVKASLSHSATWRNDDFRERWLLSRAKRDKTNPIHPCAKFRPDIGHYCRSTWEANYARILNLLGFTYRYEPVRWVICDGRRKMYRPDFYIEKINQYVEIKGMNPAFGTDGIERFSMFRQQNPNVNIILIDPWHYKQLQLRYAHQIPLWETPKRNIKTHPEIYGANSTVLAVRGRG